MNDFWCLTMIKVLHVRSTIGLYGAERVLLNLQQDYAMTKSCQSEVFLISPQDDCELSRGLSAYELPHYVFPSRKKFDISLVKAIRQQINQRGINILHTHDYKSLIHARMAALGTGVKLVHHIHGSLGNTVSEKLYSIVELVFMFTANLILTVSEEQRQSYQKRLLGLRSVTLLPNGTPIDSFAKTTSEDGVLNLIMVARFTPEKDHDRAINIVRLAVDKGVQLKLLLLGDGPLFEPIKAKVMSLDLNQSVEFIGYTNDVKRWLMKADLLLMTSKTEGMPMSVLEAMSYGLPVVSTPVGALPNLVSGSGCGEICNTDDDFVACIQRYTLKTTLGTEAKQAWNYIDQNYSIRVQRKKLDSLYQALSGDRYVDVDCV